MSQSRKGLLRVDGETWEEGDKNYRVIGYFGRRFVPELVKYACVLLTRHIITPGSVSRYEQLQSESYGDGYSYTRKASSSAPQSSRRSTGVPYVDTLLSCYVIDKPIFAVPGK